MQPRLAPQHGLVVAPPPPALSAQGPHALTYVRGAVASPVCIALSVFAACLGLGYAGLLGAIVPVGAETWFFKLSGPAALVARERTAFIECLATSLSLDDQDFLEATLTDKSKEARQAAARLLSSLPDSRFMQRMAARGRSPTPTS